MPTLARCVGWQSRVWHLHCCRVAAQLLGMQVRCIRSGQASSTRRPWLGLARIALPSVRAPLARACSGLPFGGGPSRLSDPPIQRIPMIPDMAGAPLTSRSSAPSEPDSIRSSASMPRLHGLAELPSVCPERGRPLSGLPNSRERRRAATAARSLRPVAGSPLPRVRFWQAWNEPNAGRELTPQRVNGRPVTPSHYRRMVNAFAGAVHSVKAGNLVVAGTLSPFGHNSRDIQVVAPMRFMSDLLCVSMQAPHRKTCSQRTRFDVWAQNAYTNGGPNQHAHSAADVSIGDLPEMRSLLVAAKRRGTVISARAPQFWVTEFSWDTNPPDPKGVPSALHARWVAEALYRVWQAGANALIWWRLQDDPIRKSPYQSGFFTARGTAEAVDTGVSLSVRRIPDGKWRLGLGKDAFEQVRFRDCRTTSGQSLGLRGSVARGPVRNLLAPSSRSRRRRRAHFALGCSLLRSRPSRFR